MQVRRDSAARKRGWLKWTAGVLLALVVLPVFLLVSLTPEVAEQPRPTTEDIRAARDGYRALRASGDDEGAREVLLSRATLSGLTALGRDTTNLDRVHVSLADEVLTGRASVPLPLGLWLNLEASTQGSQVGFPRFACRAGWIAPPAFACRRSAQLARQLLVWRGADLPALDDIVRSLDLSDNAVRVGLGLPGNSSLIDSLVRARGEAIDEQAVASALCDLRDWHGTGQRQLSDITQYSFSRAGAGTIEENRIRLVAIALHVVGVRAKSLAPDAYADAASCAVDGQRASLLGRGDLAMHWAYSAGLTARFGGSTATDMGEWKELNDSLGSGSGFSFVDLAADRSGVAYGRDATLLALAQSTARQLSSAVSVQLLPAHLLKNPEGLRDDEFTDQFGTLDAAAYRRAVAYIDTELEDWRNR